MEKKSSLIFSVLSGAFICLIVWFVMLDKPSSNWQENISLIKESWGQLNSLSTIWKLEFLVVFGIAFVSLNMAESNRWWNVVAIGHIIMLMEYAFMIAGYPNVQTEEGYSLMNELANWIFISSNFLWIFGIAGVYYCEKGIQRIIGLVLSIIPLVLILSVYFEFTTQNQVFGIAMPMVLALYLSNIYLGIKLYKNHNKH